MKKLGASMRKLIRLIQRTGPPVGPASPSQTVKPITILLREEHVNEERTSM